MLLPSPLGSPMDPSTPRQRLPVDSSLTGTRHKLESPTNSNETAAGYLAFSPIESPRTDAPAPYYMPKGLKKGRMTSDEVHEMLREAVGIQQLINSSSFVAVNLYAKSIFGEDALANVSIEKLADGKLSGSVRIRSRTQGIALSLGDRITIAQRGVSMSKR